jgi:hypothetical protein
MVLRLRSGSSTTANIGLKIWRLKCFYETVVLNSIVGILSNVIAKNPRYIAKPQSGTTHASQLP